MNTEWVDYVRNKITAHSYQDFLTLKIRNDTYIITGKDSLCIDGVPFDIEVYNPGATSLNIVGVRRGIVISLIIFYSEITSVS